jgi:hypothetical protein
MKITTSLWQCCRIFLITAMGLSQALAQTPCDQDGEPPVFTDCPDDYTIAIQNRNTCTPSIWWPVPEATDNCSGLTEDFTGAAGLSILGIRCCTRQRYCCNSDDFTPDSIRIQGNHRSGQGTSQSRPYVHQVCMCREIALCIGTLINQRPFGLLSAGDHAYYELTSVAGPEYSLTPNSGSYRFMVRLI